MICRELSILSKNRPIHTYQSHVHLTFNMRHSINKTAMKIKLMLTMDRRVSILFPYQNHDEETGNILMVSKILSVI